MIEPYFATLGQDKIGKAIDERVKRFDRYCRDCGLWWLWLKLNRFYFGFDERGYSSHEIGRHGERSEYLKFRINHFRVNLHHYLNLAKKSRADMKPVPATDDYEDEIEAARALKYLEFQKLDTKLGESVDTCIEYGGLYGAAHLQQTWNKDVGEVLGTDGVAGLIREVQDAAPDSTPDELQALENQLADAPGLLRVGKLEVEAYSPVDYIMDVRSRSPHTPWCVTRTYVNKYVLAAKYRHLKDTHGDTIEDTVVGLSAPKEFIGFGLVLLGLNNTDGFPTDYIPVYRFWHTKNEALENGRMVLMLTPDIILEDSDLGRYEDVRVRRVAPGNMLHTPFGWSPSFDQLAPEEAGYALDSLMMTNATTFGAGVILTPKGSDLESTDITTGLKMCEYVPMGEKPFALQMPETPQTVISQKKDIRQEQAMVMGVNDVIKGDPQASLKSGSALALVQAQGVEFSIPFQRTIREFEQLVYGDTLKISQEFLTEEVQVPIEGEDLGTSYEKFSGKSLKSLRGVKIEPINPLSLTIGGRELIAEKLADRFQNQITPEQFMGVVEKGTLQPITGSATKKRRNIQRENELLARGIGPPPMVPSIGPDGQPTVGYKMVPGQKYVIALMTDDHRAHVLEHLSVLDSPEARKNGRVVAAVMDHVDDHENKYSELTLRRSALLEILGFPPLMAAVQRQAAEFGAPTSPLEPDGGPQVPAGPGAQPAGLPQPIGAPPPGNGGMPRMPEMPMNPATGARAPLPNEQQ